ncbi:MAG TPA: RNA 2',3'-cyclic phosphodiesterase [Gemmatimonadales bacterium]|nr:RNA 2',3'-cyclic phosphodiesterase [Gemmatimonadales bacterium]
MRLFVAMPVTEPAREQILKLLGRLRGTGWPVRWVHDEGLHMTLKFFGEVGPERLDVIAEALRFAAADAGSLGLQLGELGAFPSRSRPRVLWVGVDAPPALELLQDRIERGCESIGFPPEGAPFQPHITLGRVREGQRLPVGGLDDHAEGFERVPFIGRQLVLYESVLTTSGPRYESRLTLDFSQ